jgi:hypothetical protein
MLKYAIAAVLAGVALGIVGCSSEDDGNNNNNNNGGSSGGAGGSGAVAVTGGTGAVGTGGTVGSGGTSGTGGSWNSPITITEENGQCILSDNDTGCVGESYAPEIVPLDIYIMFDQTGSTCTCVDPPDTTLTGCPPVGCNMTRLEAIRQAATTFVQDPESTGIGVGIGYFGNLPIGSASCDPASYDDPAVGIAALPGNANAIIQSLNSVQPTGETASGAAIRGACTYASGWKASHPGHEVVILLLTDGKPEAPVTCANGTGPCCPTLPDAIAAATECATANPSVKTYVLGVGPLTGNLEEIAVAGGTTQAYMVGDTNASQNVLTALRAIRGDAVIPCDLQLPPPPSGSALNPNQVNMAYADSACVGTVIGHVDTLATCDNTGGWYYDDPNNPQAIHLCPATCDMVSDPGGSLLFSVGCSTVTVPR